MSCILNLIVIVSIVSARFLVHDSLQMEPYLGIKVQATNEMSKHKNVEARPNLSGIGKMYLKQLPKDAANQTSSNCRDNVNDGAFNNLETLQIDLSDSESKVLKRPRNNTDREHVICQQQTSKEYRLFRIPTEAEGTSKSVFPDINEAKLSEKPIVLKDGLQCPLQDSFQEAENDGTDEGGILGFENESHLQDEEMLVIGEETVPAQLGVMSEFEGDIQAVMFIDDNDCACEVVIDHEHPI